MTPAEALKLAVKAAVKETVAAIAANHRGELLNGYALVTDDDLRALGHLASTNVLTEADPALRFEPVDWTYDDGDSAFERPRELLYASADMADTSLLFSVHVDESFSALVDALRELRSEGLFDEKVFLTVMSADPSEHLEALEEKAVLALNTPELHRQWKAAVGGAG